MMRLFTILIFLSACTKEKHFVIPPTHLINQIDTIQAIFTLIFDDTYTSDSSVFRIVRQYGFVPNFALKTNLLNNGNKARNRKFYDSGCSIIAHSVVHTNIYNVSNYKDSVLNSMIRSKRAIEDSLHIIVNGWVTPMSLLKQQWRYMVDSPFQYAYVDSGGLFNKTVSPKRLSRYGMESNTLTQIQARIDLAITNKEFVTFYAHRLPSITLDKNGVTELSETKLRGILSYLKTKVDLGLCKVLNTNTAVKKYYQ